MKIFHPLLALIASAADRQLARYVEFLKDEKLAGLANDVFVHIGTMSLIRTSCQTA